MPNLFQLVGYDGFMKTALAVTSISPPNRILKALAAGASKAGWPFYLIGDEKTPDGPCSTEMYFGIHAQLASKLKLAQLLPWNNYSRKNIGYLLAMEDGAECIVETDDDNEPLGDFFDTRVRVRKAVAVETESGQWFNALYSLLGDTGRLPKIAPRGYPLDDRRSARFIWPEQYETALVSCPIQQGLIAREPDVDAIWRLIGGAQPDWFDDAYLALRDRWCPFNSQNTTWFKEAFPLMYIPSFCIDAYRMDDIWRSFIAQRIAFANGWSILWGGVTVRQERNPHDLMQDFQQEIPGYLYNRQIVELLKELPIEPGAGEPMYENLRKCYRMMIMNGWIATAEVPVLEAWIEDCKQIFGD